MLLDDILVLHALFFKNSENDTYFSVLVCEFETVADKVSKYLLDSALVAIHLRQHVGLCLVKLKNELDLLLLCLELCVLKGLSY